MGADVVGSYEWELYLAAKELVAEMARWRRVITDDHKTGIEKYEAYRQMMATEVRLGNVVAAGARRMGRLAPLGDPNSVYTMSVTAVPTYTVRGEWLRRFVVRKG